MSKNYKGFCTPCIQDNFKCDRGKPRCKNCCEKGAKCSYAFTLRWGGRQYKNTNRESNIPNTKFYKGALLVKDKRLIAGKRAQRIKEFLPFEKESTLIKSLECGDNQTEAKVIPTIQLWDLKKVCSSEFPGYKNLLSSFPNSTQISDEFSHNSWEFSSLFDLFVNETSQFFVGLNTKACPNPYRTILPRMALSCPTLLKLLVAFAAKHRRMIGILEEENIFQSLEDSELPVTDFETMGEELLNQALREVDNKIRHSVDAFDEYTMAIVLLLSSLYMFSSEGGGHWRTHYNGAKRVAFNALKAQEKSAKPVISYKTDLDAHSFLLRWFINVDIVGSLSSAAFTGKTDEAFRLPIDFSLKDDLNLNKKMMEKLEDINPLNGMDFNVLAYLKDVSQLIMQRKSVSERTGSSQYEAITEAIELDYKLSNYLKTSEECREILLHKYRMLNESILESRINDYELMRSTNLIIGLTGILQLRRRVMEMSQDSKLVKGLVLQITELIVQKIPVHSSVLTSILFCLFVVGCELVDDCMVKYRQAYLDRLESLWKRGFRNVSQAVEIIQESWRLKKAWWILLEEKNLDICLAV